MNANLIAATHGGTSQRTSLAMLLALVAVTIPVLDARAQEGLIDTRPLYKRTPFDRLTTDKATGSEVHEIQPLKFRRIPPNVKKTEKLQVVKLLDGEEYEIPWFNVEKLEFFEQMVLEQANKLVADGKLDEAFDYFKFLIQEYPKADGVEEGHQNYLFRCVVDAYMAKRYDEALGVVEELFSRNPNYKEKENSPPLLDLLGRIADNIIADYVGKKDFRTAKNVLRRLESKYNASGEPFVKSWKDKLSEIAAVHRDASRAHLAAKRYVEAYDECAKMIDVWHLVEGGPELAAEMARAYPLVIVGVQQPALAHDPRSLNDPAARRTGRLVERRLMEFSGMGPEGGKYNCSLGSVQRSDDGLKLTFTVAEQAPRAGAPVLTGYDLSQHLLDLADDSNPLYQPAWARLFDSLQVKNVRRVEARLHMPHVLPDAFLQTSYGDHANLGQPGVKGSGPYFVLSRTENVARFTRNDEYPLARATQPAEVMERFFTDPQRALLAIQRGEVDVLDQVFPGDIPTLQADPDIVVARYAAPTTHFLTVLRKHPYLNNATFRRALVYGCDREAILRKGLLKGAEVEGFRTISAPFPAPLRAGDPLCYGYDDSIGPRNYDPKLALILKILATREVKSQFEKLSQKVPALAPIVIGHPSDEVSRLACKAIGKQWKILGIETKLVEFAPGVFVDAKGECDMVYVQGATWEPVVDAGRLFAPGGLTPANNTFVSLALRQIESAKDWGEARNALMGLHRQVHGDVVVIPLFQTYDHYAFRRSVEGLQGQNAPPSQPLVTLYQHIEGWQVAPRLAAN